MLLPKQSAKQPSAKLVVPALGRSVCYCFEFC
jgi:hypothetical protein